MCGCVNVMSDVGEVFVVECCVCVDVRCGCGVWGGGGGGDEGDAVAGERRARGGGVCGGDVCVGGGRFVCMIGL